jgi:hypothetical protein
VLGRGMIFGGKVGEHNSWTFWVDTRWTVLWEFWARGPRNRKDFLELGIQRGFSLLDGRKKIQFWTVWTREQLN